MSSEKHERDSALAEIGSRHELHNGPHDQHMKKRFNFWTAFGIAICCSGAWEGWMASIAQGFFGGGPAGVVWGWVFVSIGMLSMALALSEYMSLWPSAGGQYVWTYHLAPDKYARILSWYTAWLSVAALWLAAISCGFGVAVQTQAYIMVASDYAPERWHTFLISISCMVLWITVNIFSVKLLHYMNFSILFIHVFGFIIVIGVLLGTTEQKHDASFVFTEFSNLTGWDNDFVAWSIGLLSALYAYLSIDTVAHFGEEIERPEVMIPRAVILQVSSTAIMTFPFIIITVLCLGDFVEVMSSPIALMSPFTQIFINSTGNVGLSIFLSAMSTCVAFAAGFDLWGAAARAVWSLARDDGLPPILAKVSDRWDVPVLANLVLIIPSIGVMAIYLGNTTAFYGIMSGVVVAFQLSYVIPLATYVFYSRWKKPLARGAFRLGRLSLPFHILALMFAIFMSVFLSFPASMPVTAATMNYTAVLLGAVIMLATVVWFTYGNKHYFGPASIVSIEDTGDSGECASKNAADKSTKGVDSSLYAQTGM